MSDYLQAHYQNLLKMHGDTHHSAQYSSRESQEARYAILAQVADLSGQDVLDWGCGSGHFATWLNNINCHCHYTGVDIVPELLLLGQQKHPDHRFGMLSDFDGETFDWIIVSGVFNNRVEDNLSFFQHSISRIWRLCRKGIAFNLMSSWVDYEDPDLWYTRPEDIFVYMKSLTPFVVIRNDYIVKRTSIPFEYAVYAYREPHWEPQ